MTEPCEHYTVSDKPEDQPCYPRTAALLQEEEIQRLQAQVNLLRTDNAALKEKLAQYEQGQPMETAPRDGTRVVVQYDDLYCVVAHFSIYCSYWVDDEGEEVYGENLVRWWPLPGGTK